MPAGSTQSSEPDAPLPEVARVVCQEREAPTIETPAVKPQRDGVHVRFVNETGKEPAFSIEDPSEGGMGRRTSGNIDSGGRPPSWNGFDRLL
jgi:hypothetical protein